MRINDLRRNELEVATLREWTQRTKGLIFMKDKPRASCNANPTTKETQNFPCSQAVVRLLSIAAGGAFPGYLEEWSNAMVKGPAMRRNILKRKSER